MIRQRLLLQEGRFHINGEFRHCDVRIDGSTITEIGEHLRPANNEKVIPLNNLCVVPGLINSHDHLEFNLFPRLGNPPYANYVEWSKDIQERCQSEIRQVLRIPLNYRLLWGAYKNIFSGVTTVVHHNVYYWRFRLAFPLEVYHPYRWIHSLRLEKRDLRKLLSTNGTICFIHLAEGFDTIASQELTELKGMNGLTNKTIVVHGVGLTDEDVETMRAVGCGLVWCPTSNDFLFHTTAPVEKMIGRIPIALGTDSTLTGSLTLFDELRAARKIKRLNGSDLLALVTSSPSRMLGMKSREIGFGAQADFVMFEDHGANSFETFLGLSAKTICMVWRNGKAIFGDAPYLGRVAVTTGYISTFDMGERRKFVIGDFPKLVKRITTILPDVDLSVIHPN